VSGLPEAMLSGDSGAAMRPRQAAGRALSLHEGPVSATVPGTSDFTDGTMSRLSLKQAAEFAGHTKPTLLKHMRSGRLSGEKDDHGQWWFDMAELVRVYGEPESRIAADPAPVDGQNPLALQRETALAMELAAARARLEMVEQERERERRDKDATIADLRTRLDREAEERGRLALLLTDQRARPQARGLWAWLRGAP